MKKLLFILLSSLSLLVSAQELTSSSLIEGTKDQKNLMVSFQIIKTASSGAYSVNRMSFYVKDNSDIPFANMTESIYPVGIQLTKELTKEEQEKITNEYSFESGVMGNLHVAFTGSDLQVNLKTKVGMRKDFTEKDINVLTQLNKHELIELGNGYSVDMSIYEAI